MTPELLTAPSPETGLSWALRPEDIEAITSGQATEDRLKAAVLHPLIHEHPDFSEYIKGNNEEYDLIPDVAQLNLNDETQRTKWFKAVSDYAHIAKIVDTHLHEIATVAPVDDTTQEKLVDTGIMERAELVIQQRQIAAAVAELRKSDAYNWLKSQQSPEDIHKLEQEPLETQVMLLQRLHEHYRQAPPQVGTADHQLHADANSATLTIDVSQIHNKKVAGRLTRIHGYTVAILKTPTPSEVIEMVQDTSTKSLAIGGVGLALVGASVAHEGSAPSDSILRGSTSSLLEKANHASDELLGSSKQAEKTTKLSKNEARTAAGRMVAIERKSGKKRTAELAYHILKDAPLAIAEHHKLRTDKPMPRKLRRMFVDQASEYMKGMVSLYKDAELIPENKAKYHPHAQKTIKHIATFAEYGLQRLSHNSQQLTPEQLNSASEEMTNAILAATYPEELEATWHDQKYASAFELVLGSHLKLKLFGHDNQAFTPTQQDLIASFLARGIAITTPSDDTQLEKTYKHTKKAATSIAEHGHAYGIPALRMETHKGHYLPPADSPENILYRFLLTSEKLNLSPEAAAGAVGNFSVESASFRVIDDYGGGGKKYYGTGQWDPKTRAPGLRKFAKKHKLNYRKFYPQLEYIEEELLTTHRPALEQLQQPGLSPAEYASIWGRDYEGAVTNGWVQGNSQRRERATDFFNGIKSAEKRVHDEVALRQHYEHASWLNHVTFLGYHNTRENGKSVTRPLFAIHGLPNKGEEGNPASPYYYDGANGQAIFNARTAKKVIRLLGMAKRDHQEFIVESSLRSDEHQRYLYEHPNGNDVAEPGYSGHQSGDAFDAKLNNIPNDLRQTKYFPIKNGRRTAPGSRFWRWLDKNAPKVGLHINPGEPWHVSETGR